MSAADDTAKRAERERVERAVLEVYRKENPSTYPIEDSEPEFRTKERFRTDLFRDKLKFPPQMFCGADLLEFGAGTGEHSLFYLRWGAHCTLVEMNPDSVARAQELIGRLAPPAAEFEICNQSLFDFETDRLFDITVSDGVLHHTGDKRGAFAKQAGLVRSGGYTVLGIGNRSGFFQRNLQRLILFSLAENEQEIVHWAEYFFSEHLDRAERFGRRRRMAILYDAYVNPKIDTPSVAEILGWFREEGLRLYSAWPPVLPALLGDSHRREGIDASELPELSLWPELVWMTHDRDDAEELAELAGDLRDAQQAHQRLVGEVGDLTPEDRGDAEAVADAAALLRDSLSGTRQYARLLEKTTRFLEEVEQLMRLVADGEPERIRAFLSGTAHLFRGTSGLGMMYFIGYRPENPA